MIPSEIPQMYKPPEISTGNILRITPEVSIVIHPKFSAQITLGIPIQVTISDTFENS